MYCAARDVSGRMPATGEGSLFTNAPPKREDPRTRQAASSGGPLALVWPQGGTKEAVLDAAPDGPGKEWLLRCVKSGSAEKFRRAVDYAGKHTAFREYEAKTEMDDALQFAEEQQLDDYPLLRTSEKALEGLLPARSFACFLGCGKEGILEVPCHVHS